MTSKKVPSHLMVDRGERQRLSATLTVRERRAWFNKLQAAQEAVERAEEAVTKLMFEAYEAGMSQGQVGGAVGLHPTSARDRIIAYREQQGE